MHRDDFIDGLCLSTRSTIRHIARRTRKNICWRIVRLNVQVHHDARSCMRLLLESYRILRLKRHVFVGTANHTHVLRLAIAGQLTRLGATGVTVQ